MRPGTPSRLILPLSLLLVSCNLDKNYKDLGNELFAPGVGYIEAPGDSIAAGVYRRIGLRSPDLETRYVVAFNGDNLDLIRFEKNGKSCSVGTAASYGNTIPPLDESEQDTTQEPLLPYLATRDSSGRGQLRFTNFSCTKKNLVVDDVPLPRDALNGDAGLRLITTSGSGELLAIDPWGETVTSLGKDTAFFDVKGDRLWSINAGTLVLRDSNLMELGHVGTQVSEVAVSRGAGDSWAAYVDDGTLYFVSEGAFDKPIELAKDVCAVSHVGSAQEQVLGFFSPCAKRHLVLYDQAADQRFEYADNVITNSVVSRASDGFDLDYWLGDDGAAQSGEFWIAASGKPPIKVADNVLIEPELLFTSSATVIADWNGESGTYLAWHAGETRPIASQVAEQNSLGLLANFADGKGDLLSLQSDGSTAQLGSGVPRGATRGQAFVANSQGTTGDLMVIEGSDPPRKIATGVAPRSFVFSTQLESLLMLLSDLKTSNQTATLQIRLLDTGDQFKINTGVSEILEVGFPRAGILYSVTDQSKDPGIWFASIR